MIYVVSHQLSHVPRLLLSYFPPHVSVHVPSLPGGHFHFWSFKEEGQTYSDYKRLKTN